MKATNSKSQRGDSRQRILDAGYSLISLRGFSAVGLSELLGSAGVPKGSFYYYFKSKEHFGEALLDHYFCRYQQRVEALMNASDLNAREKLLRYWQRWLENESGPCESERCLMVKLCAEVADLSETMRLRLKNGSDTVISQLTTLLQQGQDDGSLQSLEPAASAEALYQLWLGASLLAKVQRSDAPLRSAMHNTRQLLQQHP